MSTVNRAARAVADLSQGTIIAVVEIEASPERVFRALTTPDEVTSWWGSPDSYRVTRWQADLRVGGKWQSEGVGADGAPFTVGGEFLEIDPPRLIVQTWQSNWDAGAITVVRYSVEPIAGGSRVTVRHDGFAGRAESCSGHTQGWEGVLGWLGRHLNPPAVPAAAAKPVTAADDKARPTSFFLCRLLPPRPTFAQDMTPDERALMQDHARYWRGLLAEGTVIAFGPVADPKGGWGVGVVRAADAGAVGVLRDNDPVMLSGRGFSYEILPMMTAVFRD